MLCAIDFHHRRPRELAFVSAASQAAAVENLINLAWQTYVPNAIFARNILDAAESKAACELIPLLREKTAPAGHAVVYICKDYACQAPTSDANKMIELLSR